MTLLETKEDSVLRIKSREICVIVFNLDKDNDFQVKIGDRIAQLILEKYEPDAIVMQVETLPETKRGSNGFGSTGK